MGRTFAVSFLLSVITFFPCARLAAQQREPCPLPAALVAPADAMYVDAMALKKSLESQGLVVHCIFTTKFSSQFLRWENGVPRSTIEGEACIRTNRGDLEVLFMLRPRTFADLKIKERLSGGRYLYTYSGMPNVWPSKFKGESRAHRNYFFRHDNYLLTANGDELRGAVEAALQ